MIYLTIYTCYSSKRTVWHQINNYRTQFKITKIIDGTIIYGTPRLWYIVYRTDYVKLLRGGQFRENLTPSDQQQIHCYEDYYKLFLQRPYKASTYSLLIYLLLHGQVILINSEIRYLVPFTMLFRTIITQYYRDQ